MTIKQVSAPVDDYVKIMEQTSQKTTRYFSWLVIIVGIIMMYINYDTTSNSFVIAVLIVISGVLGVIVHQFAKGYQGLYYVVINYFVVILIAVYINSSGVMYSTLGILLILGIFHPNQNLNKMIVSGIILGLVFFISIGKLTFSQTLVSPDLLDNPVIDKEITLVSNVQAGIIILIIAYALSTSIQKNLIKTVEVQQFQYEQLEKEEANLQSEVVNNSIRVISSGVAHNFNNLLTVILGNVSLLKESDIADESLLNTILAIEQASMKAKNMASQMLNILNPEKTKLVGTHSIKKIVEETVRFTIRGSKIDANFNIEPGINNMLGDSNQISQVVQNLVLNAMTAMNFVGEITITCDNRKMEQQNSYNLSPGPYVMVEIKDTGAGIPDDIMDRVFDMFYTTSKTGTGIGLSISKAIVEDHGGHLNFSSDETGTIFYFLLPAVVDSSSKEDKEVSYDPNAYSGLILIYDDNINVLKILTKILTTLGYEVITSDNSDDFLSHVNTLVTNNTKIDMIMLDLILPGDINGIEMAKLLKAKNIDSYLVVSSGYHEDFISSKFDEYKFDDILRKPYTVNDVKKLLVRYENSHYQLENS